MVTKLGSAKGQRTSPLCCSIKETQQKDPAGFELSARAAKVCEEKPRIPGAEGTSCRGKISMSANFKLQCLFMVVFLTALRGESRYLELQEAADYDPFQLLSANLKRDLNEGQPYRRALRCLDMLSLPGQFTFTANHEQLHCTAFFIGQPEDFITIYYDRVNINCQAGDSLKVFDGWIFRGEKFPSSQDHRLSTKERFVDFCETGLSRRSITSSQNVAMVFFGIHDIGSGFTITIKTEPNLFPCNVMSQTPNGRFTLVVPQQRQNCSFSIIYPVVIKITDIILGHLRGLRLKKPSPGCAGTSDFVELLGGTGLDPSKMAPLADLCYPFHGPAQMRISCDNTVLRLVSSGKHVNRVTFEYRQLEPYELENSSGNTIPEFCLSSP